MYKQLNLFIITNQIKNNYNSTHITINLKIFKLLSIYKLNYIKFFFKFIYFISIIKKINKTVILINDNFLIVIYKSIIYKSIIKYKFFNSNSDFFTKIIFMYNTYLVLNFSKKLIKLKTNTDRLSDICINNFNFKFTKQNLSIINTKLFTIISYILI